MSRKNSNVNSSPQKKFVAAGTYGCIFDKALNCASHKKQPADAVSKVFADRESFEEEKSMEAMIKKIDPEHKFTRSFYDQCQVNSGDINRYAIDTCKHTKNQNSKYHQIVFQDGGNDLTKLMRKPGPKSVMSFRKILKRFRVIIDGIHTLSKKKYVHLDIKPENILYNNKKFFLIDFGLMCKKNEVYTHKHVLRHDYPFYPPEFKMTTYPEMKTFNKEFVKNFSYQYHVYDRKRQEDTRVSLHDNIISKTDYSIKEQESDLLRLNKNKTREVNKIDVYSVGMVLLLLYIWSGTKIPKLGRLIKSMICFDPLERISTKKLKIKYWKMLKALKK